MLDGTLAELKGDAIDFNEIGKPVPAMVKRVNMALMEGNQVYILTPRVGAGLADDERQRNIIYDWCEAHLHQQVPAVNSIDRNCVSIWGHAVLQIEKNTGKPLVHKRGWDG